jgi:hypothetical protein
MKYLFIIYFFCNILNIDLSLGKNKNKIKIKIKNL